MFQEETKESELSKSFLKKFKNLEVESSSRTVTLDNLNISDSLIISLTKIIKNQREILYEISELKSKVERIKNRLSKLK
ncbi:10193_t:CDS:2 [Cetraspora pellucida]|uniref:10193_t:CDS:1 n=1 Tax=Cetraspora pellucida TaxID=1433469 RepID=A0A9N9B550_9GLOM|nr:10193_t:CDS:2 [Cetraspora pellucida]